MPVKKGKLKPADEAKIRHNYEYIIDQVDANYLTDSLYSLQVLDLNDTQEIRHERSKRKKTRMLLNFLLECGPGEAFDNFMSLLRENYEHVFQRLETTCDWLWFDELTEEFKSAIPSDGDLSRIASQIGAGWETVVLRLGLTRLNISQERDKYPLDTTLLVTNLLIRWRENKGKAATLLSLVGVLREVYSQLDMDGFKEVVFSMSSIQSQEHLVERLEATSPVVEQDSTWLWFDELTEEFKSAIPSDKDFNRIASHIGAGWETVVLRLGLTCVNISQERAKYPYDTTLVMTNLLSRWRRSKGKAATLLSLVGVLREVDCELDMEGFRTVVLKT